jgi:hypothetical protein
MATFFLIFRIKNQMVKEKTAINHLQIYGNLPMESNMPTSLKSSGISIL